MADNGHDITMPARLGPQNAKAILSIMVRDALDETGKNLLRLILGWVFHGRCGRITSCTHAILLNPAIGWQHWPRDLASSQTFSTQLGRCCLQYCRTSRA